MKKGLTPKKILAVSCPTVALLPVQKCESSTGQSFVMR